MGAFHNLDKKNFYEKIIPRITISNFVQIQLMVKCFHYQLLLKR
jgi:hypothetical protein